MAILKENVKQDKKIEVLITSEDLISFLEEKIDKAIESNVDQIECLVLKFDNDAEGSFCDSDLDRIQEIYEDAGWDVNVDYDNYVITLI